MWEKSQYNVGCELEAPVESIKLDRQLKKRNKTKLCKKECEEYKDCFVE